MDGLADSIVMLTCASKRHLMWLSCITKPRFMYSINITSFIVRDGGMSSSHLWNVGSGASLSSWACCSFHFSSVQFSHLVVSSSFRPHGLQHARPPCPSPTPGVCSNSCPLSQWCHPTISSSIVPFSSHLQSFPASGSFQMSQFFESGGQRIGVSALSLWDR